jgi:GNAT superfamily N-acetyltransferase
VNLDALQSKHRKKIDFNKLVIGPLDSSMNRAAFCCLEPELCFFFRDHAAEHHEAHFARVYIATYEDALVGYYWLIAQSHDAAKISLQAMAKLERIAYAPCIYLGMIAVQWDMQRNRIGRALMMHAFGRTLEVAKHVGVYALTLEAINEDKAKTYEGWNFSRFVEGELLMYIPLITIRRVLTEAGVEVS